VLLNPRGKRVVAWTAALVDWVNPMESRFTAPDVGKPPMNPAGPWP
jgi:hypothetical protein